MEKIQCKELESLQRLYPQFNFDQELEEKPELADFLRNEIQKYNMQAVDPKTLPDAPKMNDDFSNYFVINNLPKCKAEKVPKLKTLIETSIKKKNLKISEEDIDIPMNPQTEETDGVAFIKMSNEENARIGVSIFDGFKLTKKDIFAACLFSEFEKLMSTSDEFEMPKAAEYEDLKAPLFDIKNEQYFFKQDVNVRVDYFHQGQNPEVDHTLLNMEKASKEPVSWSPLGTFLIQIKPDKVFFLGGKEMTPIIVLPQNKVKSVLMSPCEKYVCTYSPMGDKAFTIWNFEMVEIIREFDGEEGEDADSYQFSHDGNYIAKKFRTELKDEEGNTTKVKEGLSVYTLPSMQLLANSEGQKKSITVNGVKDWFWMPNRNMIVYTTFFANEDENAPKVDPKVGFLSIPDRTFVDQKVMKNSEELRICIHPQGFYVSLINKYKTKKTSQYAVEIFDLTPSQIMTVAHQQIFIKRDVQVFESLQWEPNHHHLAIHTLAARGNEGGRSLTVGATRHGVDIYKMVRNQTSGGFEIQLIGYHPSEKIKQFTWSPAGQVFAVCERDNMASAKNIWSFFMIMQQDTHDQLVVAKDVKGKKGKVNVLFTGNTMGQVDEKWEFRKTARHEVPDSVTKAVWDQLGRYLCVYGVKKPGPFDKEKRSIRIFSLMGDLLHVISDLVKLEGFAFRPRPQNILSKKQITALEKDYRTKYGKQYKEENFKDNTKQQDEVRERKAAVINKFLNEFFLPLRKKYEDDMSWYEQNWPLKPEDMEKEPATINHLYAYGDLQSTKKVDL